MAKFVEKSRARKLRIQGRSIKSIAKEVGVSVSSVSSWCRDLTLTDEQLLILQRNADNPFYAGRGEYIKRKKQERELKIRTLLSQGAEEVGILTDRELFLVGVALYWSEGFKKDSQAGFANSNPKMIKLFVKWLKECGYEKDQLLYRVTVNESHAKRIAEIESYWSNVVDVPVDNFSKPFYQRVKWKKFYDNPNEYYGVLRIKVRRSTDFLRIIHGWIEGLSLQA